MTRNQLTAIAALALALGAIPTRADAQPSPRAGSAAPASSAPADRAAARSGRAGRENLRAVDGEALLRRMRDIPVASWNHGGHDEAIRHIGPMPQDWERAFGPSGDTTAISSLDMAGVTFAGVQALEMRSTGQAARVEMLEQRLRELERQLAEREVLAHRVQQLERLLESLGKRSPGDRP